MTALLSVWAAIWLGAGVAVGYAWGAEAENRRLVAVIESSIRSRSNP